jgi:hypothetical protein
VRQSGQKAEGGIRQARRAPNAPFQLFARFDTKEPLQAELTGQRQNASAKNLRTPAVVCQPRFMTAPLCCLLNTKGGQCSSVFAIRETGDMNLKNCPILTKS